MKFATRNNGTRDGQLLIVSRNNARAVVAEGIAPTLQALLDDWDNAVTKFVKVMPRDYAKALKQMEAERLEAASVAAE